MNKFKLLTASIVLTPALLAGCATGPNTAGLGGGDYVRAQARSAQQVEFGVIDSIRAVTSDASQPGMGNSVIPAVGALAGGALGSTIGKGDGRKVAMVLGALAGGTTGAVVQQAGNTLQGLEITVRLQHRVIAVTQADEGLGLRPGDQVRVLSGGGATRVAPR
jgi:outer membrane lipoprotein SlyB